MNGEGGSLIIGVSDDGEITGLEHDYKILRKKTGTDLSRHLWRQSHLSSERTYASTFTRYSTIPPGRTCAGLSVRPSHRPVYIKEGSDMRFYLRTGVSTTGAEYTGGSGVYIYQMEHLIPDVRVSVTKRLPPTLCSPAMTAIRTY